MKKIAAIILTALVATPAMADVAERNESWRNFTNWAIQRSASQHNGRAQQLRSCEPSHGVCIVGLHYYDNNGGAVVARDIYNLRDQLIRRDVCRFNKFDDNRTCIDWDTGATERHVKDARTGEWQLVNY